MAAGSLLYAPQRGLIARGTVKKRLRARCGDPFTWGYDRTSQGRRETSLPPAPFVAAPSRRIELSAIRASRAGEGEGLEGGIASTRREIPRSRIFSSNLLWHFSNIWSSIAENPSRSPSRRGRRGRACPTNYFVGQNRPKMSHKIICGTRLTLKARFRP